MVSVRSSKQSVTQARGVPDVRTPHLATHPMLAAAATTTCVPMLPVGKHAFLSYQWDVQGQVVQIKELLNERNVKCWMDIAGGMKADIYDSVRISFC